MKTLKRIPVRLVRVEYMPKDFGENVIYVSDDGAANHLCLCGCGDKKPFRIHPDEWEILNEEPLTITPSLKHTLGCESHYIITNGIANIV